MTLHYRSYYCWAWILLLVAIPLRLYFFSGFGLGDDPNEVSATIYILKNRALNPEDFLHYRLMSYLPRVLSFWLFSVNDFSLVLPILLFSLALHALSIVFARDLLSERGAFTTSLLFLISPYETLAATGNVPDYIHSFFGLACAYGFYQGYHQARPRKMYLAALFCVIGVMSRLSGMLIVPVLAIACLLTWRNRRRWAMFWPALLLLFLVFCAADWCYSGHALRWFYFNAASPGSNVTDMIWQVLTVYPRYLFLRDEYGNWMFGWSGWLGALGAVASLLAIAFKRRGSAKYFIALSTFLFCGLFEFMPHKLTFDGYWSHARIFRYMAQIVPVVYLSGAYFLECLWGSGVPSLKAHWAKIILFVVCAFGVYQTPIVSRPSWDSNKDGRVMVEFFRRASSHPGAVVHCDYWNCSRISGMAYPNSEHFSFDGVLLESSQRKEEYLRTIRDGFVITGGGSVAWYSNRTWVLNLSETAFKPPETWNLLLEYPGLPEPWRTENLRIWFVTEPESL